MRGDTSSLSLEQAAVAMNKVKSFIEQPQLVKVRKDARRKGFCCSYSLFRDRLRRSLQLLLGGCLILQSTSDGWIFVKREKSCFQPFRVIASFATDCEPHGKTRSRTRLLLVWLKSIPVPNFVQHNFNIGNYVIRHNMATWGNLTKHDMMMSKWFSNGSFFIQGTLCFKAGAPATLL